MLTYFAFTEKSGNTKVGQTLYSINLFLFLLIMKKILIILLMSIVGSTSSFADDRVYRIDPSGDYRHYSNDDLRRRVWELERAVMQLQAEVFKLSVQNQSGGFRPGGLLWTCQIQTFGKTYFATSNSRNSAVAQTLQKCGDASNPVHCRETSVKCDSE